MPVFDFSNSPGKSKSFRMYVYCFPHKRTVYFSGSADPNSGYKREGLPASSLRYFHKPGKTDIVRI